MINPYYWHKHGVKVCMKLWNKIWWRLMPGTTINVRWPSGNLVVDHNHPLWQDMGGAVWVDLGFSSDPNDHYRPWLEQNVGRQSWDWDWALKNSDVMNDTLTLKFRYGKQHYATIAALQWK